MTTFPEKQDTAEAKSRGPCPRATSGSRSTGEEVDAPKGELLIRTCERLGIIVPRFCDHPLLDPAGACRQCLVEVEMGGRPMPKPQASCTMTVADGMVVKTQHSSPVAKKAQEGVMELLLINHPLDCPICDKGGECPLQNQAMSTGPHRLAVRRREAHVPQAAADLHAGAAGPRALRAVPALHPLLRADRRRPVHRPARARRAAADRGRAGQAVPVVLLRQHHPDLPGRRADQRGVPVPVAPVRPGVHARRRASTAPAGRDPRRLPPRHRHAPAGRQRPRGERGVDRRQEPLRLPLPHAARAASPGRWCAAATACWSRRPGPTRCGWPPRVCSRRGVPRAPDGAGQGGIGVLAGGRLTVEDAYAYAKFARVAAGTNDVDFRARPHSAEELDFLAAHVVGQGPERAELHPARGRARGAVRGAGAGGGGADRLPAAAQGRAEAPAEGLPPRAVDHPGGAADGGRAGLDRAGRPRRADPRGARAPRPRC